MHSCHSNPRNSEGVALKIGRHYQAEEKSVIHCCLQREDFDEPNFISRTLRLEEES